MQEKESIAFGQILELLIKDEEGLANRQNFQGYLCNPDKFNPSDPTQPQPELKTFILYEEIPNINPPEFTSKRLLLIFQAPNEKAVADYFGGILIPGPMGAYELGVFIPRKLFKTPQVDIIGYSEHDMLAFDSLGVYIHPDEAGKFVHIKELRMKTATK